MKIIEQQQRSVARHFLKIKIAEANSVTRHFLKIKIAEANSVPAGDDYVDGTRYVPELIEATWRDEGEPDSVRITGTIVGNYGAHTVSKGYMLSRLPIELEFVRDLVAYGAEL